MNPKPEPKELKKKNPNEASFHVRRFPLDLWKKLKVRAAKECKTLRALIIELLRKGVKK